MEKNELKSRERYVDAVAGIMIAWMILIHCNYFSETRLHFAKFLGFYMPWFFYKSGMFFTPKESTFLIKKDAKKLLRYFIVYSFIGWGVWCVCGLTDGSLVFKECINDPVRQFLHHGSIQGNGALWFLLSLFIIRQLANVLLRKSPPPRFVCDMFLARFCTLCVRMV